MKLIKRQNYLDKLAKVLGTPDIKVLTGIRRSGKSKLLEAHATHLQATRPTANIIHINFNIPEYDELRSWKALYEYVSARYIAGVENYVLIDEVQMCADFERAINGLHASERYDIYITGSNAFLLSSDLVTLFTGRTFEIRVFPFSFSEFQQYYELKEPYAAFDRFLLEGGMAGSYLYSDRESKYDYLADIYNTLIVRDIRQKYRIRNTTLMERITDYLIDNIANLSSARSIADALVANRDTINHKTVGDYLHYLCNAFAFYRVRRYDIRGRKYLATNDKYYLADHAFRYARLGTQNADYGRMLENIVAIELLRRGYETYAGILYQKEIDFVAIRRNEKIYIQVADNIEDDKTFQREISPLLQIKDAYPKLLIARIRHEATQYEGIQILDIAHWLSGA
ncbi:MAG: ATP-binding protein [Deltaproteobacteria bacterium]|nr:ATP-binding protein [Deltaproteobacteria bacterium]